MATSARQVGYRTHLLGPSAVGPAIAVRTPSRIGILVILAFIGVFGIWGGLAPLAGGAVASGMVAPFGSVRTVQHLEGGIVERILVRDGDIVSAGDPLVELRSIAPQTEVTSLFERLRARRAEAARLKAELAGAAEIQFPAELTDDTGAADVIAAERRIFEARSAIVEARKRVLGQRVQQLEQQIIGYQAQVQSSTTQLTLVAEEIGDKTTLLQQGLTPKVELLRLKRDEAQIRGFNGEYSASIAAAEQQIGETQIELLAIDAANIEAASERAMQVRGEIAELEQMLHARRDVLDRTVVTAPVPGRISNMRIKTEGGVIGAGQPVLDIVPTEERLVIEVQVSPMDIDIVEMGLPTYVYFSSLGSKAPQVEGIVANVSADSLVTSQSRAPHYLARVEVEREALDAAGIGEILVGMPAEVIVVSQERTMVEYILEPFLEAMRRAGRET